MKQDLLTSDVGHACLCGIFCKYTCILCEYSSICEYTLGILCEYTHILREYNSILWEYICPFFKQDWIDPVYKILSIRLKKKMVSSVKMVPSGLFGSNSSSFLLNSSVLRGLEQFVALDPNEKYMDNHFAIVNSIEFNLSKVSNQTMISDHSAIFDPLGLVTPPVGMACDVTTPVLQSKHLDLGMSCEAEVPDLYLVGWLGFIWLELFLLEFIWLEFFLEFILLEFFRLEFFLVKIPLVRIYMA